MYQADIQSKKYALFSQMLCANFLPADVGGSGNGDGSTTTGYRFRAWWPLTECTAAL